MVKGSWKAWAGVGRLCVPPLSLSGSCPPPTQMGGVMPLPFKCLQPKGAALQLQPSIIYGERVLESMGGSREIVCTPSEPLWQLPPSHPDGGGPAFSFNSLKADWQCKPTPAQHHTWCKGPGKCESRAQGNQTSKISIAAYLGKYTASSLS
jgi:hypothetical protein